MSPFAQSITTFISLGTVAVDILIVILLIVLFSPASYFLKAKQKIREHALSLATLASVSAVIGSFVYSSVIGFIPCELCWMQRVFLFPQAIVFVIAWVRMFTKKQHDNAIFIYTLVLSLIGAAIATFHYYGQMFNPGALAACETSGISCSKLYFVEFGYVTIPMMSLSIFLLIIMLCVFALQKSPDNKAL